MNKQYSVPLFEIVAHNDSNKVFFETSGGPKLGGGLASMSVKTGSWV